MPKFKEFYEQYLDKDYICTLIAEENREELSSLLKKYVHGPLYGESLRTLRLKARSKGVANWYWLTKPTLVKLLSKDCYDQT